MTKVKDAFVFVVTNENEVDYSRPFNGNNGNYECKEVYWNGHLVATLYDHDWNILRSQYVKDQNSENGYVIRDGVLYEVWPTYGKNDYYGQYPIGTEEVRSELNDLK